MDNDSSISYFRLVTRDLNLQSISPILKADIAACLDRLNFCLSFKTLVGNRLQIQHGYEINIPHVYESIFWIAQLEVHSLLQFASP